MQAQGVADIYLEPRQIPDEWWQTAELLGERLVSRATARWDSWWDEFRYRTGLPRPRWDGMSTFRSIVATGHLETADSLSRAVSVHDRLAAIETLVDVVSPTGDAFACHLNQRANYFRVGLRLDGHRFVSLASEHTHQEIVQPTLLLLDDERFVEVDKLYRKAFDRRLGDDPSGAITAATSAVETMLRLRLGVEGQDLEKLCARARSKGWMPSGVAEIARKLHALRQDSDAHTAGTDEAELAQFALHVAGSVLLYLGDTFPAG
jgi:hypothetical protein